MVLACGHGRGFEWALTADSRVLWTGAGGSADAEGSANYDSSADTVVAADSRVLDGQETTICCGKEL